MLASKVSAYFDSGVRARGARYATDGSVVRVRVKQNSVKAVVHGGDEYDVWISKTDADDGWTLGVRCSCPYGEENEGACKHVWATLLHAEAKIQSVWGTAPKRVRIGDTDEEWEEEQEDSEAEIASKLSALERLTASRGSRVLGKTANGKLIVKFGKSGPYVILQGDAERTLGHGGLGAPAKIAKPMKPKVPAWKRMLEEHRPYEYRTWDSGVKVREGLIAGGVWYVIDAQRSQVNGAIVVELMRAGGKGGQLVKLTIAAGDVERIEGAEDRAICALLVGAARPGREHSAYSGYSYRSSGEQRAAVWQLDPRMLRVAMPMMEATGRLLWREDERSVVKQAKWSGDAPWELAIELRSDGAASNGEATLRPVVRRGEERFGLAEIGVVTDGEPGAVLRDGEVSPLRVAGGKSGGMLAWARTLAQRQTVRVDRGELSALLGALEEKKIALPVVWPEKWGVERLAGVTARTRLVLSKKRADGRSASEDKLLAEVGFEYEGTKVGADTGRYVAVTRADGADVIVERDAEEELRAVERFLEVGGKRDGYYGLYVPVKRVPHVAAGLLTEGWEVVGESAAYRKPGEVNIRVSSGIDWFDLEGGVEFGEGKGGVSATIGAVIAALRKGEKFVSLGDGSLGLLPEEWLAKHGKWLGLGREEGGAVRFSKAQLTLVDALLAAMPEATCDKQVVAARAKLRAFDGITERTEPKGFRGELRPYQRQGLGWLHFLAEFGLGGCLADDMGLGKTVQLLAHMADRRKEGGKANAGPWLVVAPKSLVFNWAREAERFTPGLRIVDHTGPERGASDKELAKHDLVLTTYATMRLDIELLRKVEFGCIVLDEAQMIKNAGSQAAKAARLLRGRRRLALTGTPVENRLEDLWSIFEFLNPGMLGTSGAFKDAMKSGSGSNGSQGLNGANGGETKGPGMEVLRRALRPFLLRRTKQVVAPELPARTEQTVRCELEGRQRALYDGLRMHYREQLLGRVEREGMNKSKMHVLEALLRLRQAACHPALIEPKDSLARRRTANVDSDGAPKGAESAKMTTLVEMLEELGQEGHKALVFSQFTSLLALVRVELDKKKIGYEELDGTTSAKEREIRVDRFQTVGVKEGGKGVFLISLKAGGVGLNLTAAGYVFLLDPWWNPAVEAQAIDRTHRIGQDKGVMAYRLIATGTVEERILELQERKRELAAAIVSENDGPLSAMTREDLEWLLS